MDPVRFRDCACPGTPHAEGDTVTFRPRLTFDQNVAALKAILQDGGSAAAAWPIYLFDGVVGWNLLDGEGDPVPLTRAALEDLAFADQYEIADRGDDIYGGEVLAPFERKKSASSRTRPTTKAGSPVRRTSSRKRRAPPAPS